MNNGICIHREFIHSNIYKSYMQILIYIYIYIYIYPSHIFYDMKSIEDLMKVSCLVDFRAYQLV